MKVMRQTVNLKLGFRLPPGEPMNPKQIGEISEALIIAELLKQWKKRLNLKSGIINEKA